jgi:hypothetical protein
MRRSSPLSTTGLVGGALDDNRQRGLSVLPLRPFVRSYLRRHPDYADLGVRDGRRAADNAGVLRR